MQITGSYMNYLNITSLLSPMGVKGSGDLVMQVFNSSVAKLQDEVEREIFSAESTDALTNLYNEVSVLASEAEKLTGTPMVSVFNDRTPLSSDMNVLTATALDAFSEDTGATEATYHLSVSQLARAQKNTGSELNRADASLIESGAHTFAINIKGQDHELGIDVADGDTNGAVLQKIAAAVNASEPGVTAEIMDNDENGTRALILEADNSGLADAFTVYDVSGSAIAQTAADNVSTEAQDAMVAVDGTDQTSRTNTIYLDDGMVTVNLEGTGDAVLEVGPNENEVHSAITSFVSEVNTFIDFNKDNSDYIRKEVLSTVNAYISDHKKALESFGITQGEDGKLDINSEKLAAAVDRDLSGIKELFAGFDGFAAEIGGYASRISKDSPLNYAKEAEDMSLEVADYLYSASAGMMKQLLTGSMLDTYI